MEKTLLIINLIVFTLLMSVIAGCTEDDEPNGEFDPTRRDKAVKLEINLDGSLQNPSWSPDSDVILFTRFRNGYNFDPADLFTIDIDGDGLRELVSDGSGNINLPGSSWNRATEMIVFASTRDPHDEIFIISDGGSNGDEVRITNRDNYVAYEPTLSPD